MQIYFKIVLTLLAAGWLTGCDQAKQNEKDDEKAIRNVTQSYREAFNQQDASKMTAQWTSDAIYINPLTGESARRLKSSSRKNFLRARRDT